MYPLDGTIQSVNSSSQLKKVAPKLADIPVGPSDVDAEVLTEVLSREDIQKIWSRDIDNTITDDQRIALYFYHRLRYLPPTCYITSTSQMLSPPQTDTEVNQDAKICIMYLCIFTP